MIVADLFLIGLFGLMTFTAFAVTASARRRRTNARELAVRQALPSAPQYRPAVQPYQRPVLPPNQAYAIVERRGDDVLIRRVQP